MIKEEYGHIVAIASLTGVLPIAYTPLYAATKHAVNGLMRSFDDEINLKNLQNILKTTTVYPYFIKTNKLIENNFNKNHSR